MDTIDFSKMIAYEFSDIIIPHSEEVSHVTVLDCKHCNDQAMMEPIRMAS